MEQWSRDHGDTSVANGILLCWYHHDYVHRRRIEMHRHGKRWIVTDADGLQVADRRGEQDDHPD